MMVTLLVHCNAGCATDKNAKETAAVQFSEQDQKVESKTASADVSNLPFAERLVDVQIAEGEREIIISVIGDGPIRDYQFRRSGENGFILNLPRINKDSSLPDLPTLPGKLELTYNLTSSAAGLQINGALSSNLDRYIVNSINNGLALRLLPSEKAGPATGKVAGSEKLARQPALGGARKKSAGSPPPIVSPSTMPTVPMPSLPETGPKMTLKKNYTGKPISLDLLDADLKNVLRLLADITNTNMVIEPDVSGKVTLKVEQVPWDQVLDLILSMNDLGKEEIGNVVRIATRARLKQEWKEQEEALRAKQRLMEAAKDYGHIVTEYFAVNYAKPSEIAARIDEIKSSIGTVAVDDRTSLVIYTDYESRIANAKRLLARLDQPTPQVMIEARVVQLNRNASRDLGISWNFALATVTGGGSGFYAHDFTVNHPASSATDFFEFAFGQLTGSTIWQVDMVLSALETAGEGKILSAPRVLTLDNVKALIKQGTQIPYLVLSDQNVASTQLVDAVLELQVTPHITPDRKVRLEVAVKKDQPDFSQTISVEEQVPIDTREVRTELLVDDGAVVVIGGIIENTRERTEDSTPGLSSVPILGRLFKRTKVSIDKTELLVFICPKIVEY